MNNADNREGLYELVGAYRDIVDLAVALAQMGSMDDDLSDDLKEVKSIIMERIRDHA